MRRTQVFRLSLVGISALLVAMSALLTLGVLPTLGQSGDDTRPVRLALSAVVTSTADSGPGTLR